MNLITGNRDNLQIEANMNVVHNILNGGSEETVGSEMELAVAA